MSSVGSEALDPLVAAVDVHLRPFYREALVELQNDPVDRTLKNAIASIIAALVTDFMIPWQAHILMTRVRDAVIERAIFPQDGAALRVMMDRSLPLMAQIASGLMSVHPEVPMRSAAA